MKEYRKRFVQLNMLLIGIVLLVVMAIIAVYMYRSYYNGLKMTMEQVVEPLGSFSAMDGRQPHDGNAPHDKPSENTVGEDPSDRQKGIMTVFYTTDSGEISVISQTSLFDSDTLSEVLETVIEQDENFGTLYGLNAIYYRTGSGSPYKIALASTDYIGRSMLSLSGLLLAIWTGAMLLFLFISIRFSKIAVRPMEQAMLREKQFVADASHDLKTPLSVILANNSIIAENPDATAGSLKRWIDSTQNAAKKMQQLIGEMLTLASVEQQNTAPQIKETDIASVVTKAELELESVAYEKNVELETDVPDSLIIKSNGDFLQRIASGLIENAIKYESEGGKVIISLKTEKRRVRLAVQNKSAVISQEDLPHVFDRFYRSDKSRQSAAGGHGLGLAITKQMTERLHGHITVESSAEKGTVFSVDFPM